ncbi:magnesium transporter CorA family protein [Arabiibacter massiliensis]|uniref:magnesium transporter CorA family protein n=1 Tax=Arabiibacter massiliensis TaxID=1870985 RepID=UPI0009BA8165|nr:CorA family divalent cation transporter [Arabiibacter massiliensis]
MARKYVLAEQLRSVPLDRPIEPGTPVAEVITTREFAELGVAGADTLAALRTLTEAESTYLDVFPDSLIGSFAVPDKRDLMGETLKFAFYLDKSHLIFIDEGEVCARVLDDIERIGVLKEPTAAHCLFEFMKLLVKDDLAFLADVEDRMEDVEEQILDRCGDIANRKMLGFRRRLLRIDTFYQQLLDMTGTIADNENKLLTHGESRLFLSLEKTVERLLKRSQTLKEYSLQLRELYQTQIDIQQNDTMQWFTVITTLFAPLTLITSWFGMNFAHMPGLDWPWGYPLIIAVCVAIVVVELVIFKRKKWL